MISKNPVHIKQKIKQQFSSAAENYDSKAGFQKKSAEELLNFILFRTPNSELRTILDIGCGTGFLTISLANTFPKSKVFACDIAHPMVNITRGKGQGARGKGQFITADCESLPYKNRRFDLIASNLTYQWVCDMNLAFKEVYRILGQDGMFIFSILGRKTLMELRECYREANLLSNRNGILQFMHFFSSDVIFSNLKDAGFKDIDIKAELRPEPYQDLFALLRRLKVIGAGNPFDGSKNSLGRGMILKRMAEIYKERFKIQDSRFKTCNCIYATYEVIFVKAKKII